MVHFKLSPNEEARLLKEERERRRKLRIQQVREQAKLNAARMRQSVNDEKDRLLHELAEQLQGQWMVEKQLKIQQMEKLYNRNVSRVGNGHQLAVDENIEFQQETRSLLQQDDCLRAQHRHLVALQRQNEEVKERLLQDNKHILARQAALEVEKIRSAKMALLPAPPRNPLDDIEPLKLCPVKFTDHGAFSTSHYHITHAVVEKATDFEKETNATEVAEEEEDRLQVIHLEKLRTNHERAEKARMRHKHAMEEEMLKQEYGRLLGELDHLNRADINRRRQGLERLPKQIFLAPHRRMEENKEQQYKMERAFEDMYMSATEFTGNLSLALDPHPPPVTPAHSDLLDLSSLHDSGSLPREISTLIHQSKTTQPARLIPSSLTRSAPTSESLLLAHCSSAQSTRDLPRDITPEQSGDTYSDVCQQPSQSSIVQDGESTLKKLFERIKVQRDNWVHKTVPEDEKGVQEPDAAFLANRHSRSTGPSLSEGTISDRTVSVMEQSAATLEEGTICTSASSYRSFQHVNSGFSNFPYTVKDHAASSIEHGCSMPPSNLSARLHEEREERQARERQEGRLFEDVLKQRQHIEEERQSLQERLSAIELKQKQLEEQDRLLSATFGFQNTVRHEPLLDSESKSVDTNLCYASQSVAYDVPLVSSGLNQNDLCKGHSDSEFGSTSCKPNQLSNLVSGLSQTRENGMQYSEASRQFSSVSFLNATNAVQTEHRDNTVQSFPHSASEQFLPKFERSSFESRIREYQSQLLQRQPDHQKSLMEARHHLYNKAQELDNDVSPLISSLNSSTTPTPVVSQDPHYMQSMSRVEMNMDKLTDWSSFDLQPDSCVQSNNIGIDQSSRFISDLHGGERAIQKDDHLHLYNSENRDRVELSNSDSSQSRWLGIETGILPNDLVDVMDQFSLDDNREFVTPELRPDRSAQLYRALDDSVASMFGQAVDLPFVSSPSDRSSKDDSFNLRVLRAQRELELRQQRMQEQLTALENEERLLINDRQRIEEQFGNCHTSSHVKHHSPNDHRPCDVIMEFQKLVDTRVEGGDQVNFKTNSSIEKLSVSDPLSNSFEAHINNETDGSQFVHATDQFDSCLMGNSISAGLESKIQHTVDKRKRVEAGRKPVLLDLYASSHSDLLNLLAEGNIPPLSGRTSPSTSWNTSYQRIMFEDLSARHEASSYQQLPRDVEGRTVMEKESLQIVGRSGESLAKQEDEITPASCYLVVHEQAAGNTSSQGHAPDVQHGHSYRVEPADRSVSVATASSFSDPETTSKRPVPVLECDNSDSGLLKDRQLAKRIFISDPVLPQSFPEFHQLGDAEQELCQTQQPNAVLPWESSICDRGDASTAAVLFTQDKRSNSSSQLLPLPDAFCHSVSKTIAVEKPTSSACLSLTKKNPSQNEGLRSTPNANEHVLEVVTESVDHRQSCQRDFHLNAQENWEAILMKYQDKPIRAPQPEFSSFGSDASKSVDACKQTAPEVSECDADLTGSRDTHRPTCVVNSVANHKNTSKSEDEHVQAVKTQHVLPAQRIGNSTPEYELPEKQTWNFTLADGSCGITDEPDITLASGATSRDISSLSQDDFPSSVSLAESSLHLFERYERLLLDPSSDSFLNSLTHQNPLSAAKTTKLQQNSSSEGDAEVECEASMSKLAVVENPLFLLKNERESKLSGVRFTLPVEGKETDELDCITSEPLSLKEALIARRPNFPQSVEKRLAQAKEKARTNAQVVQHCSEHGRTVAMWKKSRSIARQNLAPNDVTPAHEISCDDHNLAMKKIKERTKRLYNQLEEVKKRKAEEQRQKEYQQNRERRKEYEKQLKNTRKPIVVNK